MPPTQKRQPNTGNPMPATRYMKQIAGVALFFFHHNGYKTRTRDYYLANLVTAAVGNCVTSRRDVES